MNLFELKILNFDMHFCLGITYLTLAKHGALIKLGEKNQIIEKQGREI